MTRSGLGTEPKGIADGLLEASMADLSLADARRAIADAGDPLPNDLWLPLWSLFPISEVVTLLLANGDARLKAFAAQPWRRYVYGSTIANLGIGFRTLVRPYLSPGEVTALRELVRPRLLLTDWPSQRDDSPPLAYLLAASLGGHVELEQLVAGWPDYAGAQSDPLHRNAPEMVFGLGSPAAVEHHARRLRMRLEEPEHARAWLAHTETGALDWLRDNVLAQKRKSKSEPLARVLALARVPEATPVMVDLLLKSSAPEVGRQWLEHYPGLSVPGLVPVALGRGKAAETARELLQSLRRAGHGALIDRTIADAGPPAERLTGASEESDSPFSLLEDGAAPEWLRACLALPISPRRPSWLRHGDLPPLTLGGLRLTDRQEEVVLSALQRSTLEAPQSPLPELREHADQGSLDQFAWRLCELWQQHGRKTKERWALTAVGLLGGDGCALKLGPLAKTWREQLHHQNAAIAIECLADIGTDMALLQLRNFTQIQRDWLLKEVAAQHLERVAKTRGLTEEQLEDRMVPDCGLDATGTRVFDFGPRQFRLALDPELKPMLRDVDGKLRPDLPKPTAKDDPARASQATAEWKLLKKQLGEIVKRQAARLERAMIDGRCWPAAEWETVFPRQPLMAILARLLVWSAVDHTGVKCGTFRVSEDNSLAGADDEPFKLQADWSVAIPHPLHLSEAERAAWGERFSDYELVPPFPQVGRMIQRPLPAELAATKLTRFDEIPCLAIALADGLERRGWKRGETVWGGYSMTFAREFPGAGLAARVSHDPGISVMGVRDSPLQTLIGCTFQRLDPATPSLPLGRVDALVFSEVVADLAALTARRS